MLKSLLFSVLLLHGAIAQAPVAAPPPANHAPASPSGSPTLLAPGPEGAPKNTPPPAPKAGTPPTPPADSAPVPTPVCKVITGDKDWPADDVWKKEIPGVEKSPALSGNTTRPDWVINAKGPSDVQAAVSFAAKYNVRVSVINSGHDFLGR